VEHMDVRERPTHGGGRFVGIDAPGAPRHDPLAMLEVGGEDPVKASEVQSRAWHQCRKAGNGRSCASLRPRHTVHPEHKVQRFQHHVGRPITKR